MNAVIFDMDGVVADTSQVNFLADREVLATVGVSLTITAYQPFLGVPARDMYAQLLQHANTHADIDTLLRHRETAIEKALAAKGLTPTDGLAELVALLKRHGSAVALASSSSPRKIRNVLHAAGAEELFDASFSGWNVANNKPAPDIYLLAAKKLRVDPAHCIAIEDSRTGVAAAKRAGMACIALRTAASAHENLAEADTIVESLREVTPLLIRRLKT